MKCYYRVMLGQKSIHAQTCFEQSFIGADFGIVEDLSAALPEDWRAFNAAYRPVYLKSHPGKSNVSAGLACGFLWTISRGIKVGDVIICPDGKGTYRIAQITSTYFYRPGQPLPHRRSVKWLDQTFDRADMSPQLRNSTGSIGTVSNISHYADEIEALIAGKGSVVARQSDQVTMDASEFALEKHLEDFLVENWHQTLLGRDYDIFEEDGEKVGQQYQTDTGPMDILAIKKDRSELLVVELKKGRASDAVIGQVLRYMGYVKQELAEENQIVRGAVIALEDDLRLRRAIAMAPNISFFRYQVSFRLEKAV